MRASVLVASGVPAQAGVWQYTVVPNLWGPEFRTSLDIGPNPPVDGNDSIFNILDGLFQISGEAHNGRWAIGAELNYIDLSYTVSLGSIKNAASWELNGTMAFWVGGYAVYDDGASRVDVFA